MSNGSVGFLTIDKVNNNVIKYGADAFEEYSIMHKVESPYTIKPITMVTQSDIHGFTMPKIENGTLRNYILLNFVTYSDKIYIIYQLIKGIIDIHNSGVIHRDIKPDNIFMEPYSNIKIGDFGSAKEAISTFTSDIGSIVYSAPETFLNDGYDNRCDIYSLGLVIYFIMFEKDPFEGEEDIHDAKNNHRIEFPQNDSIEYQFIIKWCTYVNPNNRPPLELILEFIMFSINGYKINFEMKLDFEKEYSIILKSQNDITLSYIFADVIDHPMLLCSIHINYYNLFKAMCQGSIGGIYEICHSVQCGYLINDIDNIDIGDKKFTYDLSPSIDIGILRYFDSSFFCVNFILENKSWIWENECYPEICNLDNYVLLAAMYLEIPYTIAIDMFDFLARFNRNAYCIFDFYEILAGLLLSGYYFTDDDYEDAVEFAMTTVTHQHFDGYLKHFVGILLFFGYGVARDYITAVKYIGFNSNISGLIFISCLSKNNLFIMDEELFFDDKQKFVKALKEGEFTFALQAPKKRNKFQVKIMRENEKPITLTSNFYFKSASTYTFYQKSPETYPITEFPKSIKELSD